MNEELKTRALEKMLTEMNEKHSPAADKVHNWLCDQEDEEMYQGILKDGKTIQGAFDFAKEKARKQAINSCACIEDVQVYEWVHEYFTTETPVATAAPKKAVEQEGDDEEETVNEPKPVKVKKPTKAEILAAEKAAKEKAIMEEKEAARKAAKAPKDQTSIFDFGV